MKAGIRVRDCLRRSSRFFEENRRQAFKPVSLLVIAVILWISGLVMLSDARDKSGRVILQEERFTKFLAAAAAYRDIGPRDDLDNANLDDKDPVSVLSSIIERLELRDSLVQMSSGSTGVSLQLEGLFSSELSMFLQETERTGLFADAAEISTLLDQGERLFTASFHFGERP